VIISADSDIVDYDDLTVYEDGSPVDSGDGDQDIIVTKRDRLDPGVITVTVAEAPN
jgi:hypothetical protein